MTVAPKLAWVTRILELAPLRWMGRRSYAAYLWHYVPLTLTALILHVTGQIEAASLANRLIATPMVLVGTWVLAALSYELVFKPSQKLKPLLEPRRERAAPAFSREAAAS